MDTTSPDAGQSPNESRPAQPLPLLAAGRTALSADDTVRSGFVPLPGPDVEAREMQRMFTARFPEQRHLLLRAAEPDEPRMKRELSGGWR